MSDEPKVEDNSTIREMRSLIEAANKQAKEAAETAAAETAARLELENKLKEIERSKLDENERLKLSLQDSIKALQEKEAALQEFEPLRDQLGRFQSKFESMYQAELAAIPESVRASVEALTLRPTYAEAYEAIQAYKATLPPPALRVGTVTQPGGTPPAPVPEQKPNLTFDDVRKMGWGDVLKAKQS